MERKGRDLRKLTKRGDEYLYSSLFVKTDNMSIRLLSVATLLFFTFVLCYAETDDNINAEFERLYSDWCNEVQAIQFSSRTEDYINLPAFRKIVAAGRKILPFLKEKIETNEGDFLLVYAVVKINHWNLDDFGKYDTEQELRERVLKRMAL